MNAAKMRAAAADHLAHDDASTSLATDDESTLLSRPAISPMPFLESPAFAIDIAIIRHGIATEIDAFSEDFIHGGKKHLH